MTEKNRWVYIILIIISVYTLYIFQDDIKDSFLKVTGGINVEDETGMGEVVNKEDDSSETSKQDSSDNIVYVDKEDVIIDLVDKSSPAVVSVVRNDVVYDYRRGPIRSENSIGTGFLLNSEEGVVLTNNHVVEDSNATYKVVFGDVEQEYDVTAISKDPLNDFAILRIDTRGDTLPGLDLADSDDIKRGQTVVAIGNALGQFGNSVTKGIVSGLGRGIVAQSGLFGESEYIEDVIQTDAALNPGNSGGPLLNLDGEVIGINVAVSQGAENIGFSIPINALKPAINTFMEKGTISRPFLGVEYRMITKDIAEDRALPIGAFIERVVPDSPADQAGLEIGDIVLKVNGLRVDGDQSSLAKIIISQEVDQEIDIIVDRNGKEETLKVTLQDLEG